MKNSKLLPLFLALGLVLSGCSKDDSDTNSNSTSTDSNESSSLFGNILGGGNDSTSTDSNESSSLFGNILGGGNDSTSADEMRLENYTGNITLENNSEAKAVVLGSRLVTGDNIETMIESNTYVILNQSKVLRVNETSQIEIIQEEKHLDIYLSKGTVFFNVKSALTAEESLEFHTNNVVTGVRGTSGIIHYDPVAQITQIVVLTGTVTGTTIREEQNIEAGQVAIVETLADGTVEMTIYELEEDDPLYYFSDDFIDGIQGDLNGEGQSVPLSDMVRVSNNPALIYELYVEVFAEMRVEAEKMQGESPNSYPYINDFMYMLYDMTGDGIPELFTRKAEYFADIDIHYVYEGTLVSFPDVYRHNEMGVAWHNGSLTGASFDRVGLTTASEWYDGDSIGEYGPSVRGGLDFLYKYVENGKMKMDSVVDPARSFSTSQVGVYSTPLPENWYTIANLSGLEILLD